MLINFYGRECGHCHNMFPLVEKLEKELGVKVEKLEVWYDKENQKKMAEYGKGRCLGVPFFYNTETGDLICGEDSYEALKKWAKAKK